MTRTGVNVAVIEAGHVLLLQRLDWLAWALPEDLVREGESLAQAAMRAVYNEAALRIELREVVGVYSVPEVNLHVVLYSAVRIGGILYPTGANTADARFFPPLRLPDPLARIHSRRISDVFNGAHGSASWTQQANWPHASHPDLGVK